MRRAVLALALLLAPSAWAGDLVERVRVPDVRREDGRPVYVASLTPYAAIPALFQIIPAGGGGGGTTTITSGTTATSGCTAGGVLHSVSNLVVCSDTDITFATDTLTVTKLSTGGAPTAANAVSVQETAGCITFEGSTSNTIQNRICTIDPASADSTFNLPSNVGTQTFALLSTSQTWIGGQTFVAAAGNGGRGWYFGDARITANSSFTPDGPALATGALSNSWRIAEEADVITSFDFSNGPCGTAACTDPTVIVNSHNQDTAEWVSVSHDGTAGSIQAANSTAKSGEIKLGRTVALTEAGAAETVITITTATTESFGLTFTYQVRASDVTPDYAVRHGSLKYVCVNNATVVTCTKDATNQTDDESVLINTNSKTLTYAIASDVATANVAKLTFDIDSDMTVTAASITWVAILHGSGTIS